MNPSATDYFELAQEQIAKKQWQQAMANLHSAIQIEPKRWEMYFNLGIVFLRQKHYHQAIENFKQAIILNSNDDAVYYHLGTALAESNNLNNAIISFCRAIAINPRNPHFYYNLGQVLIKQNFIDKALICFRKVFKLNPSYHQLQFQLGKFFRNQGLPKEATVCFCRAIKLNPNYAPAYISLRYIELEPKWLAALVEFYRQIIAEHPDLPEALANLSQALARQDNIPEAIIFSRQAIYIKTIKEHPNLAQIDWQPQKQLPPDFMIIGAGKAGTTSLYKYLGNHPQILLPNKKELRFFDRNFNYGQEWYLAQFPPLCDRPEFLTGEASPSYFFSPHVAQRIKNFAPKIKLIVMLRNPVARTISDYYQNRKTGSQNQTLSASIQQQIKLLKQKNERQLAYGGGAISQSLYYYKLKRWLGIFAKNQFLILKSEDFFVNPTISMERVYQFLDLPNVKNDYYPKYNTGDYPEVEALIEEQLKDFFLIHNQRLEDLLQTSLYW